MTAPIAPIGPLVPPALPTPTIPAATGPTSAAFDAALSTALGGNPLASIAGTGLGGANSALASLIGSGAVAPASVLGHGGVIPGDATATSTAVRPVAGTSDAGGVDLAGSLANGFDAVQAAQHDADTLAVRAAAGQIVDPAQLTIAMTKAQLMTQVAAAVQSKAVTAFNTIMSLQA